MQAHQSRKPLPEKIDGTTQEHASNHPIQMKERLKEEMHQELDRLGVKSHDGIIHLSVLERLKLISPFHITEYAAGHPDNPFFVNETPPTKREEILREAIQCVTKDRNATHGDPEDNFTTIAGFWNTYLDGRTAGDLTAADVATMMILMKVSRTITSPEHKDHWIDIAGYAACGGGIACNSSK
jgi:Domain of unknown function (DUF6378)